MRWIWTILLTTVGIGSAQAYTCEDVRALSPDQQAYYIKVFNITPAQQQRIRQACYGQKGHHPGSVTVVEASSVHVVRGEREARADQ
jgi:hypothetical protein